MATPVDELAVTEDLLDRYVRARMRLRRLSSSEANPNRRTCAKCGERVEVRYVGGGWSICPLCGRYA